MQKSRFLIPLMLVVLLLSSCYHKMTPSRFRIVDSLTTSRPDTLARLDSVQLDSLYFVYTHHYHVGFNFVTRGKHLFLTRQQPEEIVTGLPVDSFAVDKGKHLVVADVRILSTDPVDSVWVQVATEDSRFGWVHERRLLHEVDPDDPISQFISFFSNVHLLVFLIVISIIAIVYAVIKLRRGRVKLVHFNDIDSFYPTLLAISVASAATFYSSIQMLAPETWQHFYYHPSLNPFAVPPILSAFLVSVWAMVIMTIATIDDVYHKLSPAHATLYLSGLAALCSANYIIFSITTLYYIGYILLLAYIFYAVKRYVANNYFSYVCGKCGAKLTHKGRCPHCGTLNT